MSDLSAKINTIKKEHIVEAVESLIAKEGYENITMAKIAKNANISRQTLYTYFKSTEDVLLSYEIKESKIRSQFYKKHIKNAKTGLEKLYLLGDSFYTYFNKYPNKLILRIKADYNILDQNRLTPDLLNEDTESDRELTDFYRNIFLQGQKDGSIKKDVNIDLAISYFLYTLRTVLYRAVIKEVILPIKCDKKDYYYEYLKMFLSSIKTDNAKFVNS